MAGRGDRTPTVPSSDRTLKSGARGTRESHSKSRHQRWYQRHHAESRARSALRGWALRNRAHELVEHGIALSTIHLPKALVSVRHSDARIGDALREERARSLRESELALVERRWAEAKEAAERLAADMITRPLGSLDDLVDLGRAFDLVRDTGTFAENPLELWQAFERQKQISRSLDAYWYRVWPLDRRRFTPYLVKSFLHHASLWRIYGFLTDGSVEYRRAEELARHALQVTDAVIGGSESDQTLQFFRFDALIWYGRIRGVHEQVYDRDVVRCIAEMGAIARAWPRRDQYGFPGSMGFPARR